jgi:glycosyltransferase involved in cell wall biosynthesis
MGRGAVPDRRASVIVPVRNGAHFLRTLIPALKGQTVARDDFEVVIADDGSTDGLIEGIAEEDDWLRVTRGDPETDYAARNRGASIAGGRNFAFIDADCVPVPTWLEEGLAALEGADMVAGAVRFIEPAKRTIWTLIDMDATKNQEAHVKLGNAETANLFVRRSMFEMLDGFDPAFRQHGDFDLAQRCVKNGGKLVYSATALARHPTREVAAPFLRMTWGGNRWYAARVTRDGGLPNGLKLRNWVPVVQVLRGRKRVGKSAGLDKAWLAANGVRPSLLEQLKALPIIYLLLPYMGGVAQLLGWRDGRRLRRQ